MQSRRSLTRVFLPAVLVAACGAGVSAVSALTGNAAAGQTIYAANCARCHGSDGASGSAGRPIASVARTNADEAISVVLAGDDEMPSFSSTLSSQDIADVMAYLKTL